MKITQSSVYTNRFMKLCVAINTQKEMEDEYTQRFNYRNSFDILTFTSKFYLKISPTKNMVIPGDPHGKINVPTNLIPVLATVIEKVYVAIKEHPKMYLKDEMNALSMDKALATEISKGFMVYDDHVVVRPDIVTDYEGNQIPGITFWSRSGPAGGEMLTDVVQLINVINRLDSNVMSLLLLNMSQLEKIEKTVDRIEKKVDELLGSFGGNTANNTDSYYTGDLPQPRFIGDSVWKN